MSKLSDYRHRGVNIIVPIYNALRQVVSCVESVLGHATGDYAVLLIDDASTDPELVRYLKSLPSRSDRIKVIRNSVNGGFVRSVNCGLSQTRGRDVLLLNSDTVVTPEFLDRLRSCVYSEANIGIASPLSNNATICSVPDFCKDNPLPPPAELDEYARLISATSLRLRPRLPTAVGFCMYIRAEVIEQIGLLDEIFGKGFGEENDYCERAKAAGFDIRLCDDAYVAHVGKASFGAEGFEFEKRNSKIIAERYPNYFREVADFCRQNPLAKIQENVRYQVALRPSADCAAVLYLLHANPFRSEAGGTEFHVLDLLKASRQPRALIAYPQDKSIIVAAIYNGNVGNPVLHRYPLTGRKPVRMIRDEETETVLARILEEFSVGLVHIQHLFGWPINIWTILRSRRVQYAYTIHDYYCVCPNNNLLNYGSMTACGSGQVASCGKSTACLAAYWRTTGSEALTPEVLADHSASFAGLLENAHVVIAPSRRAAQIVENAFPSSMINIAVVPHGLDTRLDSSVKVGGQRRRSEALRIGMLGCINFPWKGAQNYLAIIEALREEPIQWHFFGDLKAFDFRASVEATLPNGRAVFHGFYLRDEAATRLADARLDLVVIAAPSHETFSYTLSETLIAGRPVLSLRRGAIEERLENCGLGECLAEDVPGLIEGIRTLLKYPQKLESLKQRALRYRHKTVQDNANEITALYGTFSASVNPNVCRKILFERHWDDLTIRRANGSPLVDVENYYPAFWYPTYRSLRSLLPLGVRSVVRDRVIDKKSEWRKDLLPRPPFNGWLFSEHASCRARKRRVRVRSTGDDPWMVIPGLMTEGLCPDYLRLRIRLIGLKSAFVQVFWTNRKEDYFSEERSIRVPVSNRGWQDLVLDLRRIWADTGSSLGRLRIDPIDAKGEVDVAVLSIGKFKSWQLDLM